MTEFIENIFNYIQNPLTAYVLLFLSAYTENVVPPIPGDVVVIIGAYLVTVDKLNFWGVYIVTTLGSLAGFNTIYLLARHFGYPFINHKIRSRLFKEKYLNRVSLWFNRWGYWVIFANRFLSGTRSVISLFAGLFHLEVKKVIILSLASSAIWNMGLMLAGLLIGKNWHMIVIAVTRYNQIIFISILIILFVLIVRQRRKKVKYKKILP